MTPEVFTFIRLFFPWGMLKLGITIMVLLYTIFAAIIVRQEQLMSKVVEIPFSLVLRLVAIFHLVVSILALFMVFTLL